MRGFSNITCSSILFLISQSWGRTNKNQLEIINIFLWIFIKCFPSFLQKCMVGWRNLYFFLNLLLCLLLKSLIVGEDKILEMTSNEISSLSIMKKYSWSFEVPSSSSGLPIKPPINVYKLNIFNINCVSFIQINIIKIYTTMFYQRMRAVSLVCFLN